MPRTTNIHELRTEVATRAELQLRGRSERSIAQALQAGDLVSLSRTHCIEREVWDELWPDGQLLARVLAVAPLQRGAGFFCRESAAVLLGLPLTRSVPTRAQVLFPPTAGKRSTEIMARHTGKIQPGDVRTISGIPCTSLERTLLDLARFAPIETALVCLDAGLRDKNQSTRSAMLSREAAVWFEQLSTALESLSGSPGYRRARHVFSIADHGAESPLESVARLRFTELGYRVRTQVPVPSPNGGAYYADLELVDVGILVEVDGQTKYVDESLRGDRSVAEVFLAERRREEWTRGRSNKRIIRVVVSDVASRASLLRALRAQQVPPPRAR